MIFIGSGALLERAIEYTISLNIQIDFVYTMDKNIVSYCTKLGIESEICPNINLKKEDLVNRCSDNVVFSINNDQIIEKELIKSENIKFYNVHNGILPNYRGLPHVCVIYSLLHNEKEYGVSLHRIDEGVDTGQCIDIMKFDLTEKDTFETVMFRSIELCSEIFKKNLLTIYSGDISYLNIVSKRSTLYKFSDLNRISSMKNLPGFKRATDLGLFKWWFIDLNNFLEKIE